MNLRTPFIANAQPTILVHPSDAPLNDPTMHTQSAPMRRVAFSNHGSNATLSQGLPRGFRIVAPISLHPFRAAARASGLSAYGWNGIDHGINWVTLLVFAPVKRVAKGMPCASVTRWCLLPDFARSVGFEPVFSPDAVRAPQRYPRWHVTNQADPRDVVSSTDVDECVARHPPIAIHVTDANTSCPNRSPIRGADISTECRFSIQTRCRSMLDDSKSVCVPENVCGAF
jgi:hypothetical protein